VVYAGLRYSVFDGDNGGNYVTKPTPGLSPSVTATSNGTTSTPTNNSTATPEITPAPEPIVTYYARLCFWWRRVREPVSKSRKIKIIDNKLKMVKGKPF
jgi:hypothetical protein